MKTVGENREERIYIGGAVLCLALVVLGVLAGDWATVPQGLYRIMTYQDVLITDYFAVAGPAAALLNAAVVCAFTLAVLRLCRVSINGFTVVVIGLMTGFSFFGKNLLNTLPILAGTWLYSRVKGKPFSKYASAGLLASALGPAVSYFMLHSGWGHVGLGLLMGVVIGFCMPPLSSYTYKVQNGMNLYNMGFACGLLALVIVPVMAAMGRSPTPALHWSVEYRLPIAAFLGCLCLALVVLGSALGGREAWRGWRGILKTSGRAPSDYLLTFGLGPTLVNMGLCGAVAVAYLLLTGADFNGPTLGGVFTIIGFAAFGKHPLNILPVMAGVGAGGALLHSLDAPAIQLAGLFGTTLAPLSGHFGWPVGVLAGFLHSCIVLRAGVAAEGVNLYNNGFSAGILAIVLYGVLTPLVGRRRRNTWSEEDYFHVVTGDSAQKAREQMEE